MPDAENTENFRGDNTCEDAGDITADFVRQYQLTLREVDVLSLLITGHTNAEIADVLSLSKKCIEHHLRNLYIKLGVKKRANAIICAMHGEFIAKG